MRPRIGLCFAAVLLLSTPSAAEQAPGAKTPPKHPAAGNEAKPPTPPGNPPAKSAETSPPTVSIPPPEVLLLLIRTALVALDQANKTGNYTVLREMGGPSFQKFMSANLSSIFADLRTRRIDLSPAVVVTPQMFEAPSILSNGMLRLKGFFPTQPLQIDFELLFERTNVGWKLSGLRVSAVLPNPQANVGTGAASSLPGK